MDLQLENINVIREKRQIIKDISFTVRRNEFVGILGPSGCGKSTLIEILSLTGLPSSGRILFDAGLDIAKHIEEYKKLFRYVPQYDALYPALTILENVWYAARLLMPKSSAQDISDHINLALVRVGLKEHQDKQIFKLSGGQRKRVSIAMALLGRPRLLILDEPASGLDPAMERKLMLLLKGIAESGTTVLCSTHVMENIKLFDKVAVIDKIKLVGQETECGKLLDFLPTEQLLEKMYEKNDDYGNFFEKLEADPGVYYWNTTSESSEWKNPLGFILANFVTNFLETLRPVGHILIPCFNFLFRFVFYFLFRFLFRFTDNVLIRFPELRQTYDLFERSLRIFRKDRFLLISTLFLPFILGFLIALSQQNESNIYPLLFFAIIVSLWFGMNNSVRGIVSERKWYIQEHLSGLGMNCFLFGKALFYFLLGFVQIGLLWQTLYWCCRFFCPDALNDEMILLEGLMLPGVLFGCYGAGVGLGLVISTLASTESVAVALVPLFIMPQILLSTVAAGNSADSLDSPERIRPVMMMQTTETTETEIAEPLPPDWELKPTLEVFRWSSFFCYSRPALMMLELKIREYPNQTVHYGEHLHFFSLVTITWFVFWLTFRFQQNRWQTARHATDI
ncbi:MAG: ATP-binding cassette domain-containing protein [Planctomycetaceae bacterium]|jgi:ABC-type multidrug transport system ATPase subunit|nr:ATP-binding cassette domain-containing protein [Planctomycetaceae bacterium]